MRAGFRGRVWCRTLDFVEIEVGLLSARRGQAAHELVQVIVLPRVPQVGDLAEQLPPVVGLTIADMQGAHLVEPMWIVPLHLVESTVPALGNPPGLQGIEYLLPTR